MVDSACVEALPDDLPWVGRAPLGVLDLPWVDPGNGTLPGDRDFARPLNLVGDGDLEGSANLMPLSLDGDRVPLPLPLLFSSLVPVGT